MTCRALKQKKSVAVGNMKVRVIRHLITFRDNNIFRGKKGVVYFFAPIYLCGSTKNPCNIKLIEATSRSVDFIFRYASLLYYNHFYLRSLSLGASPFILHAWSEYIKGSPHITFFHAALGFIMQIMFFLLRGSIFYLRSAVFHFVAISVCIGEQQWRRRSEVQNELYCLAKDPRRIYMFYQIRQLQVEHEVFVVVAVIQELFVNRRM